MSFFKPTSKTKLSFAFTGFEWTPQGNLRVNRDLLHQSEGYQRQVQALDTLRALRTLNASHTDSSGHDGVERLEQTVSHKAISTRRSRSKR